MARYQRKSLRSPDEEQAFPYGWTREVHLEDVVVGHVRHYPGWRWSQHVKPIVGTEWCEVHHMGVMLSGRFRFLVQDGTEVEVEPLDVYDVPPGHDGWVVGDEPVDLIEWVGVHGWASPPSGERVLATLMFTDIVESTPMAERLGDRAWTRLLEDHNATVRRVLERFRGREVDHTGDGIFAMFDGAERCLRAALAIRGALDPLNLVVRIGVHTGEVEVLPHGDLRGLAVHTAARVMGLAQPGEVLVSGTTRDLVEAPELRFVDRGAHELKGVSRARQVYALET